MKTLLTIPFLLCCYCTSLSAQFDTIYWSNPSFEGLPNPGQAPPGWFSYHESFNSPVDLQPGSFGCKTRPKHGKTYVGMVMRNNGTFEGIGQRLGIPVKKDSCYQFSAWVAISDSYKSITLESIHTPVPFTESGILILAGKNTQSGQGEVLAISDVVDHVTWEKITFTFKPVIDDLDELGLFILSDCNQLPEKNGNVLLDHLSPIYKISPAAFESADRCPFPTTMRKKEGQ